MSLTFSAFCAATATCDNRRRRRTSLLAAGVIALAAAAVLVEVSPGNPPRRRHHARLTAGLTALGLRRPLPAEPRLRSQPPAALVAAAELAAVRRVAAFRRPLFCAGRSRRMVALTFDDGPGVYTRLALKKLRQARAQATFFLVGKEIRVYPRLVGLEKPVAAFGDHTMTHPFLPALAPAAIVREIARAKKFIQRVTGEPVVLFRPPYEGRTPAIDREVTSLGMLEVLWNVDSRDSEGADYAAIEHNVIAGLRPGAIILMHENHGQTIRALPAIFAALARRHLRAVTVPELLRADPPSRRQLQRGIAGCSSSLRKGNGS